MISVIIPAFNSSRYIKGCITSLLSQTYKDIEIIVVNDGSTDNTSQIVSSFTDERVKLINKENGGVSSARNAGIKAANGEIIAFSDADDEYYPTAFEKMLKLFDDDLDWLICSHDEKYIKMHESVYPNLILNKSEIADTLTENFRYYTFVWGNLYRKSILESLSFDENMFFSEDGRFNFNYLKLCNKIKISSEKVYNYYISRGGNHTRIDHPVESIKNIIDFFSGEPPLETYLFFVKRYLNLTLNRYISWYKPEKAAELLKIAVEETDIDEETVKLSFDNQLENGDYLSLVKKRYNSKEKLRYHLSMNLVKILRKISSSF